MALRLVSIKMRKKNDGTYSAGSSLALLCLRLQLSLGPCAKNGCVQSDLEDFSSDPDPVCTLEWSEMMDGVPGVAGTAGVAAGSTAFFRLRMPMIDSVYAQTLSVLNIQCRQSREKQDKV